MNSRQKVDYVHLNELEQCAICEIPSLIALDAGRMGQISLFSRHGSQIDLSANLDK